MAGRLVVVLAVCMAATPVRAADPESGRKVGEANRLVAAGKYDDAFKIYDDVEQKVTDSPELAYDRGVTYYRKGDRAKAVEQFTKALLTRDIKLEAKTKFNLGNCAYADALDKQENVKEALDKLKLAVSHYKEAIAANPDDQDAKVNIETAQLLMKHLLDQEKKKQDEQKKNPQSQPESQPSSQPESQPASQPEQQPQSQPSSQPDSGKNKQDQKQGEKKKDEQKQGDSKKDEQKQADQKKSGDKKDDQQAKDEQGKKLEPQEQQGKADKDKKDGKNEQAAAQPVEVREMSKEEAEKLLQIIRDRERQRREGQLRLLHGQPVPVDKDW